jgi:hypothetical protein
MWKLMQRNLFLQFLLFLLIGLGAYYLWIYQVNPFPDRDGAGQLYFPFLNYLFGAKIVGNDFSFLRQVFPEIYPDGLALFPAVFHALGLNGLFFSYPWLLNIVLIFPLALIPFFFPLDTKKRFLAFLCIFFIPVIQLTLKSYSPHAFCVVYFLLGYLLFSAFLETNSPVFLIGASFCFVLSIISKHLGIVFFLNFAFAGFFWILFKKRDLSLFLLWILVLFFCCLPFYPHGAVKNYLAFLFSQNPELSIPWVFGGVLVLILAIAAFLAGMHRENNPLPGRWFACPFRTIGFLLLTAFLACSGTRTSAALFMGIAALFEFVLLFWLLKKISLGNIRGYHYLQILLAFFQGLILYYSGLGHTYMVFSVPVLLMLFCFFMEAERIHSFWIMAVIFILLSNGMPSLSSLQNWFGRSSVLFYENVINGVHQNPFGWQKCELSSIRTQLSSSLEKLDYSQFSELAVHMHLVDLHDFHYNLLGFDGGAFFGFPPLIGFSDWELFASEEEEPAIDLKRRVTALLESGKVPVIIRGKYPWVQKEYQYHCYDSHARGAVSNQYSNCLPAEVEEQISTLMEEDESSNWYRRVSISSENISLDLYIHENLHSGNHSLQNHAQSISSFKQQYRQFRIPAAREAQDLFVRASALWGENQLLEAAILLLRAGELDPQNQEVQQDLGLLLGLLHPEQRKQLRSLDYKVAAESLVSSAAEEADEMTNTDPVSDEDKETQEAAFKTANFLWNKGEMVKSAILLYYAAKLGHHEEVEADLKEALNSLPDSFSLFLKTVDINGLARLIAKEEGVSFPKKEDQGQSDPALKESSASSQSSSQTTAPDPMNYLESILARINAGEVPGVSDPVYENHAMQLFSEAGLYFETNPDKAEELLLEALKLDPQNKDIQNDLSVLKNGRSKGSADSEADFYFNQSNKYFDSEPERAWVLLKSALDISPDHEQALSDLDVLEQAHPGIEKEGARLKAAGMLYEDAVVRELFSESNSYYDTDPEKAIEILERILLLKPNHVEAKKDIETLKQMIQNQSRRESDSEEEVRRKTQAQAMKIFLESNQYYESEPEKALWMLQRAHGIAPWIEEISKDLMELKQLPTITEVSLRLQKQILEKEREKSRRTRLIDLLSKAEKKLPDDPDGCSDVLEEIRLILGVDDTEIKKELMILERRVDKLRLADETKKFRAMKLYEESADYFKTNPEKARELLNKAKELYPGNSNIEARLKVLDSIVSD